MAPNETIFKEICIAIDLMKRAERVNSMEMGDLRDQLNNLRVDRARLRRELDDAKRLAHDVTVQLREAELRLKQ